MVLAVNDRSWLSPEWLVSSKGGYFVIGLTAVVIITSIVLMLSSNKYHLEFKSDPKVEAHLAECDACRNQSINIIWNHIPPTQDRASSIQSHLDACASCQRKVRDIVHEHTQLQTPFGGKARHSVPLPSHAR